MTQTMTRSSKAGKKQTQGLEVIRWIEKHCCFTQAQWYGEPFKLLPWQKVLIAELFETDDAARRRYRWAYISVAKKNGKTELMAAIALWFLIASGEPSPLVVCSAGSDDQADLIFGAAKTMAQESSTLKQVCECFEGEIQVPSIPGAKLVRVAAASRKHSSNLDGKNVYVVICDELHVWEGEKGEIVWGTLTRGTVARREPMIIQITTAGFDRESICWKQYQHALKVIQDPDYDPAFYAYVKEAPEGADWQDAELWEQVNPSFGAIMHEGFYRDQMTKQPENEFRRFYLNQWTRSAESWLPPGAWEACKGDATIPPDARVWLGVDVALYHDSTSVAIAWPRDDGRIAVQANVWRPDDNKIDLAEIMAHIRDLADQFSVQGVVYDPRFFDYPAAVLMDEGIPMIEVPQNVERMVPACGYAWEQIVAGNIVQPGDPTLDDHVLSAAQRPGERGWTLSKGKSKRKIDACIALVLALHQTGQAPESELVPLASFS